MRRREFISELKNALDQGLTKEQIHAQVNYYTEYIEKEMDNGRLEEEVIADLGDPFALAQNILSMTTEEDESSENGYREAETGTVGNRGPSFEGNTMQWNINSKWGCWVTLIVFVLIVVGVLAVLFNLIQFFLPVLVPVVLIIFVWNFFQKKS